MEFRMAALSTNTAIASTAQSVASGIEIAASKPGGLGSISNSFQNTPTSDTGLQPAGKFAPSAAIEMPNQYFTRLNDLQRDASGLVSTSDLTKSLADPNLDVVKETGSFHKQLQTLQSEMEKRVKEAEEKAKELQDQSEKGQSSYWNQVGNFLTGDDSGMTAQDRMGNFEIQRLMSAFNQAESLSSNVTKKKDDILGSMRKIG